MFLLLFWTVICTIKIISVNKNEIEDKYMRHCGTQTIKTSRLVLRKVELSDAPFMFENWQNDERVCKYLSWNKYENKEQSVGVCKRWLEMYKEDFYLWVIVLDGIPIGTISARQAVEDWSICEVGYCIGYNWWRKGYTYEALKSIINFMFIKVGVKKVVGFCDNRNIGSYQVMRKCGMKCDGVHYGFKLKENHICDVLCMSLEKKDYLRL